MAARKLGCVIWRVLVFSKMIRACNRSRSAQSRRTLGSFRRVVCFASSINLLTMTSPESVIGVAMQNEAYPCSLAAGRPGGWRDRRGSDERKRERQLDADDRQVRPSCIDSRRKIY